MKNSKGLQHKRLRKEMPMPLVLDVGAVSGQGCGLEMLICAIAILFGTYALASEAGNFSLDTQSCMPSAVIADTIDSQSCDGDASVKEFLYDDRRLRSYGRAKKKRRSSKRRLQLEAERRQKIAETMAEIDALHAEYWVTAGKEKGWRCGVAYARFSTRFQESIADQVRKILDYAVKNQIRIPRELIYFDLATRGVKQQREGLGQVESVLRRRQASVLLLFSTSRLFRKTFLTLQFVDTIYRQLRARCVFVVNGIDTDNRDQWESLLHLHALMDQFVVRANVAHIHAAHIGMLEKGLVFGSLCYGFGGRPIEGRKTKRGFARRELIVDEQAAPVVVRIFKWYVEMRLDIIEIVRRLNADPDVDPPSRCDDGWSREAVRTILTNERYRGVWRYGEFEGVFLPEADYVRQFRRPEALKEMQFDALRIVEDGLWFAAQERLNSDSEMFPGRPCNHGTAEARPALLNGFVVCPEHEDQILYVGGSKGNGMFCPLCQELPVAERSLFTILDRRLATRIIVEKLVELICADSGLVEAAVAACRAESEAAQRPDPQALTRLRHELGQIERAITLTRRTAGESREDQEKAEREVRELQGEGAGLRVELARLESIETRIPTVPNADEVRALLQGAADRLSEAAESKHSETIAEARRLIELLTGGRIAVEQQGTRTKGRGWLTGRFRVRLLSYLVGHHGGRADDEGVEVTVDFRKPSCLDRQADRAWELEQAGVLRLEIARRLKCGKSYVLKMLRHAAAVRGVTLQDGRARRSSLERKHQVPPLFAQVVPKLGRLVEEGLMLVEIGEQLNLDHTTLTMAYNKYRADKGLPPLDGRARRKLLDRKSRPRSEEDK